MPFPEIRLPAPADVPPIVLLLAPPLTSTPANVFPSPTVPLTSVPMKLPSTWFPLAPAPLISTPCEFPEIRLRAPGDVPPIELFDPLMVMLTPGPVLPSGALPVTSAPMKLPRI